MIECSHMKEKVKRVYGIGNPLIDIIVSVEEQDILDLGIHKGTMALINKNRMTELLSLSKIKETSYSCGGSCPNTIIALAALGVNTTLAGKIGKDENGEIYTSKLRELNIEDELEVTDKEATGSTVILITPDSERSMNTFLGANRLYEASDVHEESVAKADFFSFYRLHVGYLQSTTGHNQSLGDCQNKFHHCFVRYSGPFCCWPLP